VYLSLSIKGIATENNSAYKTIIVDKLLQFENYDALATSIDQQLTLVEDDLIESLINEIAPNCEKR